MLAFLDTFLPLQGGCCRGVFCLYYYSFHAVMILLRKNLDQRMRLKENLVLLCSSVKMYCLLEGLLVRYMFYFLIAPG